MLTSSLTGTLPIEVNHITHVGVALQVKVGPVANSDGQPVTLIAWGTVGPRVYQTIFQHQFASFRLSSTQMQQSGTLSLQVKSGNAQGATSVTIQPGSAVEPLIPLVGARAVIADAFHWSMVVVVPTDAFGNPVTEGTQVEVQAQHPDNTTDHYIVAVHHLLAWSRITSHTTAGRTTIAVQIGSVHGPAGTLTETAGWPVPFQLSATPSPITADGQRLLTISTASIRDRYGNVMPDGTLVTFVVDYPGGATASIPTQTIDGVAQTVLQVPQQNGTITVYAMILGASSRVFHVNIAPGLAIDPFAIHLQHDDQQHIETLRAGPLLGPLGQYVPDGTNVRFKLTSSHGAVTWLNTTTQSGYAQTAIHYLLYPAGTYAITVFVGSTQTSTKIVLP
jgi:hypothetical protein